MTTTAESPAARLLHRLRAAGINPVLCPDGALALPSGTALPAADIRQLNKHAGAIRTILIWERRAGAVKPAGAPSQRVMVAAKIANLPAHRPAESPPIGGLLDAPPPPAPVSQAAPAGMLNVSTKSVKPAITVRKRATPDLVAKVERGDMPVSVAADVALQPVARAVVQEARRRLQQAVPDELAALESATRDGDPAVAAHARRTLANLMFVAMRAPT